MNFLTTYMRGNIPLRQHKNAKPFLVTGFTLLVALVGISIILIAVATAFGIAPQGLIGARYAKNQITATYFAQEGHEVVRNLRDKSMYFGHFETPSTDWLGKLTSAGCVNPIGTVLGSGQKCVVDPINNTMISCPPSGCPILYMLRKQNGDLVYGNGPDFVPGSAQETIFTREVEITRIGNDTAGIWVNDGPTGNDVEIRVHVKVRWTDGQNAREINSEEHLFDWWTSKPDTE